MPSLPPPQIASSTTRYSQVWESTERTLRPRLGQISREEKLLFIRNRLQEWPWPAGFHLPSFSEFVTSSDYLGEEAQPTERQLKAVHEAYGPTAWHWFCQPRRVNALWLVWGKGSGKDLLSAWILSYSGYAISTMLHPWSHFGMPLGEAMDFINVAQDKDSAQQAFFSRLIRMLRRPCFKALGPTGHPLLDQSPRGGDINTNVITFRRMIPHLGYKADLLRLLSLHSRNEAAEGKNTLGWVLDEGDALKTADGHANADKLLNTLTTSNRFGSRQLGVPISYPRDPEGFMLQNLAKCSNMGGTTREWHGDLSPTWQVLPWKVYIPVRRNAAGDWEEIDDPDLLDGTEYYTNHDYRLFLPATGMWLNGRWTEKDAEMTRIYRDDPELFQAMYACHPRAAEGAFFSQPKHIDRCIAKALRPVAEVEPDRIVHEVDGERYEYVGLLLRNILLRPGARYFLGGDAGETNDSFALCLAHVVPSGEHGYLCPQCFLHPEKRIKKHYRPVPCPEPETPEALEWRCDECSALPDPVRSKFWTKCQESGRSVQRPVIERYAANGDPIYRTRRSSPDAEPETVWETVWEPLVVEDLLLEWQPNRSKQLTVSFPNVRDAVLALKRAADAAGAVLAGARFDKWNSTQMIQELREAGVPCESKSFSNPEQLVMYRNYKTLVYNHRIQLLPQQERARKQLKALQMVNSSRIDHPKGAGHGKDLTDAEALAFQMCCEASGMVGRIDLGFSDQDLVERQLEQELRQDVRKRQEPEQPGLVARELGGFGIIL